jgi:hypothetical protein
MLAVLMQDNGDARLPMMSVVVFALHLVGLMLWCWSTSPTGRSGGGGRRASGRE